MKRRFLYILAVCLIIGGVLGVISSISKPENETGTFSAETVADNLQIIRSNTTLRTGDSGFITIQGRPGTKYTINTTYRIGNTVISVSQMRVTGAKGQATFNWVVSPETVPGTYTGRITGDGKSIGISHTVLP